MLGTQLKEVIKATAQVRRASVQGMSEKSSSTGALSLDFAPQHAQSSRVTQGFFWTSILLILQFAVLTLTAPAAGLQSNAAPPSSGVATISPAFIETLRPALEQAGNSVGRIQIDHWKVSKTWKEQMQSDADSIAQDLSHQLPGLFQQAQASPAALDAQMRVMQNVDALYDVLVRLTMAADLTEKKTDAALLDSAVERLEAARKTATAQLVSAAALQNQQLVQLQARVQASQASPSVSDMRGKTIVVDNEARHGTVHRTPRHKKPVAATAGAKSQPKPSTGNKPAPQ